MRYLALLAMVLGSLVPCQAQNLMPNGEFDSGISGWTPPSYYHNLYWDPLNSAFGPGGSAYVSTPFGIGSLLSSVSPCVPVTPGVTYSWGAQYRFGTAIPTDSFFLVLSFTVDPSCTSSTGTATFTAAQDPTQEPPGPWRVLAGRDVTAPPGATGAIITAMLSSLVDSQTHTVSFDDVYFGRQGTIGPHRPTVTDVPALSPLGLGALALALGTAAVWLLRGGRSRASAASGGGDGPPARGHAGTI